MRSYHLLTLARRMPKIPVTDPASHRVSGLQTRTPKNLPKIQITVFFHIILNHQFQILRT